LNELITLKSAADAGRLGVKSGYHLARKYRAELVERGALVLHGKLLLVDLDEWHSFLRDVGREQYAREREAETER
jgi:hypothetical protein